MQNLENQIRLAIKEGKKDLLKGFFDFILVGYAADVDTKKLPLEDPDFWHLNGLDRNIYDNYMKSCEEGFIQRDVTGNMPAVRLRFAYGELRNKSPSGGITLIVKEKPLSKNMKRVKKTLEGYVR